MVRYYKMTPLIIILRCPVRLSHFIEGVESLSHYRLLQTSLPTHLLNSPQMLGEGNGLMMIQNQMLQLNKLIMGIYNDNQ